MAAAKVNERNGGIDGPTNPLVTPLLTDLYQFTMAYAYWKAGKHEERAVFDLYFRKNPFGGEYTVFAGLEECVKLIANFRIAEDEIAFIRASLPPSCEDGFYDYLRGMDCSNVEIHSISEGYVVFPNVPLMRVEGPIAVVQLLETPLLNLINYASLVATNAARHRFVAGKSKLLLEFGLQRAQGPDGGIGASKYSYMGGFDATSNVAAGKLFGIPLRGTHSHAFVSSFMEENDVYAEIVLDATEHPSQEEEARDEVVHVNVDNSTFEEDHYEEEDYEMDEDMELDVDDMSYEELLALEEQIGNVSTGLKEEEIFWRIKWYRHITFLSSSPKEEDLCGICLDEYIDGQDIGELDCCHKFHHDCIKKWLMQKNTCPVCKRIGLAN